jgi:eukaryotic-like serine/threonine-protein kinase
MSMIGKTLSHYEVTGHLGKGGMGEVYQAKDRKLGRDVAIKVLPEEFARDADRVARFQREAKVLASLNHPNIATIHGLEEYGGTNFLVLELVEGQTLADRIKNGAIPVEEALKLALQIAEALEAAHGKKIIHRDLKPSNIMVTDKGSVKLLDFGLAKLYEQDAAVSQLPTADYPATQAGAILGTVAYMSPEQAQGQPADARSDIFSFGLVLYEMLSGRRAFTGDSTPAIMAALLRDNPSALQTSPSIEKLVQKCLAKQPSGRHQAISEVRTALERISAEKPNIAAAEMQPSIAVLPFVNMSGDKEQEYFSDGLAEEIINALAQIPGLKVIARTSAFAFRGKEQDITKIAEALRVRTILEGSVRKAGNRIRVTAQLIDAADGSHIWSERYDREMEDVFAIQDEISQAISEKLRVRLSGERPLVRRHTQNVEAYSLYLKARYHSLKLTLEGLSKGREYCEQAVAIDPDYALAWFGLADFYNILGYLGFMRPKMAYEQCLQAALKALELDETLPQAHAMIATLRAGEYDWKGSEREFARTLEIDPEPLDVRYLYNYFYLVPMRRFDEAISGAKRVLELDPLSPMKQFHLGLYYFYTQQWDRAIKQYFNAIELDPHYYAAHFHLGDVYTQTGKLNEAIQVIETSTQLMGRSSFALQFLGVTYARAGRIGEARKLLEELHERAQKTYVPPSNFAHIYVGLGESDEAFDWLEKAVDEQDSVILQLHVAPIFDPLRSHPRYHALLRRMNLEP